LNDRSSIEHSALPDSPFAEELRSGGVRLRFAPAVEEAFRQEHLKRARVRTRTWGVVTAFFGALFTVMQLLAHGPLHPISFLDFALVPVWLVVAWLPWSRFYLSHYLPIVSILTPLTCTLTAPLTAQAVSQGQFEVLIMFALQIVAIFQFTGLLYRTALVTVIGMVVGLAVGMVIWALPTDAAIKYVLTMCMTVVIGAVTFRDAELLARRQFLEGKLLNELLERDPLTGLKNRRSFDEHLQRIWLQAQRDARTIAVIMIDVDDFKSYNDTYGHQAGDATLRRIGAVLREFGRRPLDLAARYGGEEFALIMNDVTSEHAGKIAEQVRAAVAALRIEHSAARATRVVTLSVGVAVGKPVLGRTPQGLVGLADEALYEAKAAGRNRIVVRGPDHYNTHDTGIFSATRARMTR
jgi:diguanylate cyclase (GGDEF)-like protein